MAALPPPTTTASRPRRRRSHALWMLFVMGCAIRWLMISAGVTHDLATDSMNKPPRAAAGALQSPRPPPPPPPPPPRPPFWRIVSNVSSQQAPPVVWILCAANGKYLSVSARNKVRAAALDNTHARAQWVLLDVVGADGRRGVALRSRLTGQLVRLPPYALDPQLLGTNDTRLQASTDLAWEIDLQRPSRLVALSVGAARRGGGCLYHDAAQPSPALDLRLQRPCEAPARRAASTARGAAEGGAEGEVPASHRFEVGRVAPEAAASPLAGLRGPVCAAPGCTP